MEKPKYYNKTTYKEKYPYKKKNKPYTYPIDDEENWTYKDEEYEEQN